MEKNEWTIVIKPKRRLWEVDIKGIWAYRDLYLLYVKRNISVVYKQTVLGPLWFLIQPILTLVMYMFVFGGLAGISTEGAPQPLFYLSGIIMWNYFSTVFNLSATVFTANSNLFGKVYFPRLIVPIANMTSELIKFGIQFGLFVIVYIGYCLSGYEAHLHWTLLLFPLLIAILVILGLAWGLIISSMTAKYRDLAQLISFGLQLFMYATPIIYSLQSLPDKYRQILLWNPLSSLFEAFKYSCLDCGSFSVSGLCYSIVFALISLFVSILVFSRVERNFMDTI